MGCHAYVVPDPVISLSLKCLMMVSEPLVETKPVTNQLVSHDHARRRQLGQCHGHSSARYQASRRCWAVLPRRV